jgi:UDP-N-acetyl-D-mannosaminuronic acid transferase (WecB/TagA/CpsF family)
MLPFLLIFKTNNMTQKKSKTIYLKLSNDEVETVIIALMESKLPKSKDDVNISRHGYSWNKENEKVFEKIQKQSWEQQ